MANVMATKIFWHPVSGFLLAAFCLILASISLSCGGTSAPSAGATVAAPTNLSATATPLKPSPFAVTFSPNVPPTRYTGEYVGRAMKDASDLGAKSLRLEIPWQAIETREGRFDWAVPDRMVQAAEAAKVELVLTVSGYSLGGCCANFPNLYGPPSDQKLRAYESFLRQFVQRYKGNVRYWQIENEVALPVFWGGSTELYVSLLSSAYRVIKSEDQEASILLAGIAGTGDPAKTKALLEQGRDYFNIADVHLYFPPEELPGKIAELRAQMKQFGYEKPIWVTETGGPHPCGYRGVQEPPPELQGSEVVRRYAELLSVGVERVFWFGLQRNTVPAWGCPGGEGAFNFMQLVRGQERRPAFATYQLMVQKLGGFTAAEGVNLGEGISAFRFSVRGNPVFVLWSDKERTLTLPMATPTVAVTDIAGVTRRMDAKAVTLTTSPVFVEEVR